MWTTSWNSIVEKIEAFEPNPDVIPMFKDRTAGIDNVTLHEVALGDKFSSVSMQYETHTGTYHVKDHSGTIEMKTLDSYNFKDVDIIKIDVEGYEVPLLEGAKETILNNRPVIQIEANHTGDRYGRPKIEISKILSSFGMKRIAKEWPDQIWRFRK
jgi:FkbM family methyltransferase